MQPDQNPDLNVQEEKPETVKETEKKETKKTEKKQKKQLTKKERELIVQMLKGEFAPSIPEKKSPDKKSKSASSQINKSEKTEIVDMLHDNKLSDSKEETSTKGGQTKKQISKSEKEEIRLLLGGGLDEKEPSPEEIVKVDIDYDQLNKQELVELLEEVVEERDISKIKGQVAKIKTAFYHQNKDDIENEKQAFVAEGGDAEKFEQISDPLELRFNTDFGKYRHNKSKYAEEL